MACRIEVVAEVRAWLDDLRHNDPVAATLVDEAVDALAERGQSVGPPLVVPLGRDQEAGLGADDWYQHLLDDQRSLHRGLADVATSRARADATIGELESAVVKLAERLRGVLDEGGTVDVEQLRADLSSRSEHLDRLREERAVLLRRERQLTALTKRAAAAAELYRLQRARI